MMIPRMTTSPLSPRSSILTRVWNWFVYDAVEADAICLCACHLGAAGHCTACVCVVCPNCRLWIQSGKVSEHRQQCDNSRGMWQRTTQSPKAA